MNARKNGLLIKKAKRVRGGVGFVAGYRVNGEWLAFGWGLTQEEARRAVLAEAEAMGLVIDGIDANV